MSTVPLRRRVVIAAGGAALVALGSLTACSPTTEKEAPSTTSTPAPTSSSAAVTPSPTEKAMLPGGDESFSPTVNPAPPGPVCKEVINGVCIR